MIHSFAVLKKIAMATYTFKRKTLVIFFTISFPFATSLSLMGTNWVETMQIRPIGNRSSKESVHIFIHSHVSPCCWHIMPANSTSTDLQNQSCLHTSISQQIDSRKQRHPRAAQVGSSCLSPHYLAHSTLFSHQGRHINPNSTCNRCFSQLDLWGVSMHCPCLFIPLFTHFLNCCSSYLLYSLQYQETASCLS